MFEVINPAIFGTLKTKYDTDTALDAAKNFWNNLSKIIISEIPKSFITLKDDSGKLYHYKVTETKSGANIADFNITEITGIDKKNEKLLKNTYEKIDTSLYNTDTSKKGGRKHRYVDDDDSSSSSDFDDDDIFSKIKMLRAKQPVAYYKYVPHIYGDNSAFIPVFMYPYQPPYIEIGFSSALWG